jgi:hypothetical protein
MVGRQILSGTLDRLLKENPSKASSGEVLSFALDILEHHMERKLVTRKLLGTGANG